MATADNTNPLGAFIRAFQQGRQGVFDRQQQQAAAALNEQLKQLQIATAQAQLLEAQKTPQQRFAEQFQNAMAQRTLNQGGVIEQAIGPVAEPFQISQADQDILGLRAIAEAAGGAPATREGIAGISPTQMQTAVAGQPGFVQSPAAQRAEQQQGFNILRDKAALTKALEQEFGTPDKQVINGVLAERQPDGTWKRVLEVEKPVAAETQFKRIKSNTDPKDVRIARIDVSPGSTGLPPEGYSFADIPEGGMKPSELITSRNQVRDTYEKLPTKLDYFGSGQVRGSRGLKEDLDSVLNSKSVNGDFKKLSGTASDYFITRMNKLSDPTSATLIAEADRIAGRVGVGDRLIAYFKGLKTGQQVAPEIAKQIYDVISSVEASQKERLINSLIPFDDDIKMLGKDLTFIGVPSDIQKEVEARIASGQSEPTVPRGTVPQDQQVPAGMKIQMNTKTGETRLVPIK